MFEKETKFITDYILNKIKNIGAGVTVDKLLPKGVHPAVMKYISSELDYLIFVERKRLIQNSAFDYSSPEIAKYFTLIAEEIKKTKVIGFEDIRKLVVQAVSFNLNFICRPKWALIKLIFDGKETVSADEIKMLLNHIYYYEYLRNIISSYLTKRNLKILSAIEFELIINKVDKELYSAEGKKLIENTLWSLGEFINIGGTSVTKIPVQPVETFLKEKNQIEMLFRLRKALPIESRNLYEIEDLKSILFSSMPMENFTAPEETFTEEIPSETGDIVDSVKFSEFNEVLPESNESDINFDEEINKFNETSPETEKNVETPELKDDSSEELTEIFPETEVSVPIDNDVTEEEINFFEDVMSKEPEDDKKDVFEEDEILKIYDEELKSLEELEKELDFSLSEVEAEKKFVFEEEPDIFDPEEIEKELLTSEEFAVTSEDGEIPEDSIERLDHLADAEDDFYAGKPKERFNFNFFRKKEVQSKEGPKDIISFFTEKETNKIISVVFNEDKDDFTTTLEKISECKNYDEATEIIKSVFLTYRINPYTREAVSLTNAVANYFNQGQ